MTYRHPIQARYLEVDAQGVVFNMWFLGYVDDAFNGYLKSLGLRSAELIEHDVDLQVVRSELDFHGAFHFDEEAAMLVRCDEVGRKSVKMSFELVRGEETLTTVRVVYVAIHRGGGSRLVPDAIRDLLVG
ncbi:acyl-CoA thioesterase [Aeromicrobium sp. P5_D10]